jgi:ABC-type lipoprotein release transport system permease subunit
MGLAVYDTEAPRRFNTVLITSFAFAAVLLAVLGIYSVIAFSVASRVAASAFPALNAGSIDPVQALRGE